MLSEGNTSHLDLYQRVCESYHAVDDFRMKLLGLLPLATGAGVFLLLNGKAELINNTDVSVQIAMGAIGAFGFLFTLGLFCYELFGIKKCHYLILTGKKLETDLQITGQFRSRPPNVARYVAEPFASSIIYPTSMASWLFLGLVFAPNGYMWVAVLAALTVFVLGFAATMWGSWKIKQNQEEEDRLWKLLRECGPIQRSQLQKKHGFKHLKATVRRLQKRDDMDIVEVDKERLLLDVKRETAQGSGDQAAHEKAKPGSSGKS
jgi:hypothetical protein